MTVKDFSFTVKRVFINSENEARFKYCQRINAIIPFDNVKHLVN